VAARSEYFFTRTDAVREPFWSAVINGVIAVPIMVVMMLLGSKESVMGQHVIRNRLRRLGWPATFTMTTTVVAIFVTL
jgi:Mn2+/Fe2+ NRAMP family transporter